MSAPVTRRHLQWVDDIELSGVHAIVKNGSYYFLRNDIQRPIAQALADIEAEAIADREHLERGAELLATLLTCQIVEYTTTRRTEVALDKWLKTERTRMAKTPKEPRS